MRPQRVNDAGDRPGMTTLSLIWKCDSCPRGKTISESPPEGWAIDEALETSICPDCLEEE